jgi:hypothetical protein
MSWQWQDARHPMIVNLSSVVVPFFEAPPPVEPPYAER